MTLFLLPYVGIIQIRYGTVSSYGRSAQLPLSPSASSRVCDYVLSLAVRCDFVKYTTLFYYNASACCEGILLLQ